MSWLNLLLLVVLSAIWGSSFILMRILAPILGPLAGTVLILCGTWLIVAKKSPG